jgi:hypothetical protein
VTREQTRGETVLAVAHRLGELGVEFDVYDADHDPQAYVILYVWDTHSWVEWALGYGADGELARAATTFKKRGTERSGRSAANAAVDALRSVWHATARIPRRVAIYYLADERG